MGSASSPSPKPEFAALGALPTYAALLEFLLAQSNDLERPAIALAPVIADVVAVLRDSVGCKMARMSGSGATCFALYRLRCGGAESGESAAQKISELVDTATTL